MAGLGTEVAARMQRLERELDLHWRSDLKEAQRWVTALRAGKIFFYGTREVEIGLKDIDWSGRHVAHQEWPAQLNRFFWLPHVATVYEATGDETVAALARATIEDWITHHDYGAAAPPGPGDNTLNVSIRLGQTNFPGWWGTLVVFARSPHFDDAFVQRMLASTQGQLACLAAHLAPVGNWRISHLDCLLFCSLLAPGLEAHQQLAVRQLNETFHRQVHDDGAHEEHNPSYHSWMCHLFTNLWKLARARPELGLCLDSQRVARMWDYLVYATAPDGGSCGLHDGGVWHPGPGRDQAREQRAAFLKLAGLDAQSETWELTRQPCRYFAAAGQVFLRDDWGPEATWLTYDVTRWGGGHCHLSRLGVNLYAGRRMLLCDPGVFSYEMSDPYASYGKCTVAHNTVNLGGLNQTDTNPDVRQVHLGDGVAVLAAQYGGGYFPGRYTWWWEQGHGGGVFGQHDRVLLWLKGRGALVFDAIRCDGGGQPFAAHWQFPVGPAHLDEAGQRAWTGGAPDKVLVQCLGSNRPLHCQLHEGERDPLLGWLPGGGGGTGYQPAPLLAISGQADHQHVELVTLLYPFRGDAPPPLAIEKYERGVSGSCGFRFTWPDGAEDLIAATPALRTQVDHCGPLASDGALAWVSRRQGRVVRAFVLNGLYLTCEGQPLINESQPGVWDRRF